MAQVCLYTFTHKCITIFYFIYYTFMNIIKYTITYITIYK